MLTKHLLEFYNFFSLRHYQNIGQVAGGKVREMNWIKSRTAYRVTKGQRCAAYILCCFFFLFYSKQILKLSRNGMPLNLFIYLCMNVSAFCSFAHSFLLKFCFVLLFFDIFQVCPCLVFCFKVCF